MAVAHMHAQGEYRLVPVALIDASATNPRTTFDEAKLAELAESIGRLGVQQPIVLRPKKKRFEIVAGERRWRAARLAGLVEIPAMVRELSDTEALEIQIIENDQRADVHPLEQMEGYRRLLEQPEYGGDRGKLAERIGKSVSYIHQRLKLGDAADEVKAAFRAGRIKSHHASMIAREPAAQQKELLSDCVDSNWSVKELQEHILRELRADIGKGGFDPEDAGLLKRAPACSVCPKLAGNCQELHPDARPTSCTDVECYRAKQQAHLDRTVAAAKKAGEELLLIKAGNVWARARELPKGTLHEYEYTRIGGKSKKCDLAQKALIVQGEGVGKIVSVCVSRKCKAHAGAGASAGGDEKWKEDERKRKEKVALGRVICSRAVDALIEKASAVPEGLDLNDPWLHSRMEDWAEEWYAFGGWGVRDGLAKRHPEWDADSIPVGDLDGAQLVRLLNGLKYARFLDVGYGGEIPSTLREDCGFHKVDLAAIEAAVKAELAAKGKKAPKKIAAAPGPFTAKLEAASSADEGRAILAEHQSAIEELEERLGVPKTVGLVEPNYSVSFGVLKPKDLALTVAAAWAKDPVRGPVMLDMVQDGLALHAAWERRQGAWARAEFEASVARLAAPWWDTIDEYLARPVEGERAWPAANDDGVFSPASCLAIEGRNAFLWIVETPEGWRESFTLQAEPDGAAAVMRMPTTRGNAYPSAWAAIAAGLDGLSSQLGEKRTGKAKKRAAEARAWVVEAYKIAKAREDERVAAARAARWTPELTAAFERATAGAPEAGGYVEDVRVLCESPHIYDYARFDGLQNGAITHRIPVDALYRCLELAGVDRAVLQERFRNTEEFYVENQPERVDEILGESRPWWDTEDVDAAAGTADDAALAEEIGEAARMRQCPKCSAFCTQEGLDRHVAGCEV